MNTEKSCKEIPYLTVALTVGVLALISVVTAIVSTIVRDRFQEKIERQDVIHAEALRNQSGLPASLENLQEGAVYAVSVSMMNIQNGTTNYFAVLREVKVVTDSNYRYKEPRFFKLPFSLDGNRYYQFFRSGTGKIARAEEYPPPTPPKLELRYK